MEQCASTLRKIRSVSIKPIYDTTAAQYYMDVRNGKRDLEYLHDDLEPILKDSNGVFVYQEEIMKFLVEIVGYTWEESDVIRSAIAKKKSEVIMATFDKIRSSCRQRGWTDEAIETVCQQIMAFSRYSFNKSHSHAYGELGYITMYLKHHHPLEWWASVLNLDPKEDKMRRFISKLGSTVRPPSLRNPTDRFVVRDGGIVAPVSVIKGVGPVVVQELCRKGPFSSLDDFVTRVDHTRCNIGSVSALIKGRAADDLMDASVGDYAARRKKFIEDFKKLRSAKTKTLKVKEDLLKFDPLSIFLMEKETNKTFNRTLLSSKDIVALIKTYCINGSSMQLRALKETGRTGIPFFMGDVPILGNIAVAEGLLKKMTDKDVGMILLFQDSSFTHGVSRKSGRKYTKMSANLSDGYHSIECLDWKAKRALGWPKNSIVYVRGQLKEGWRTPVNLDISEIQLLTPGESN